jgi:hypothetical protein
MKTKRGAGPRRRSNGLQLRTHGSHGVRTAGRLGRLTSRLAAGLLDHANCRRRARLATNIQMARGTSNRAVASTRRWTLR